MSLRRTPLARKTPLRASSSISSRKAGLNRRAVKAARRPRPDTGPSKETLDLVLGRALGRCECCLEQLHSGSTWIRDHSFHHRRPRAMGGSSRPDTNGAANILLLCGSGTTGCHGRIESYRRAAYEAGLLLRQSDEPAEVAVMLARRPPPGLVTSWALLDDDGTKVWVNPL